MLLRRLPLVSLPLSLLWVLLLSLPC